MPVLLLAVAVVVLVGLMFALDRMLKVGKRVRRRREANRRLIAAAAAAEAKNNQKTAKAAASKALTSLIPAIHDHNIRHVE
jgi:uncharacterized protein HemY